MPQPFWKKKIVWISFSAALVILAVFAFGKKPIPVKVQELRPDELRVVVNATTTSTVKSEFEVTLSAQRTGRVVSLPVREGDRVKAGAVIARLDLTEEEAQSESALKQSKALYQEAQNNLERMEDLFAKGMIAQQELDAVRRAYQVAKSQYDAAVSDVQVRRDYSVVAAPFDGVVAKKFTETGELLLPGKQIVTLVDPERIYILATIDEVDVGRLKPGLPVSITVDAFPGEDFLGVVKRISPIVSGGKLETRTADVWVYFSKKDGRIKPGMSADVEILVARLENVLSVPTQAILDREGKKKIYVAAGNALKPGAKTEVRLTTVEIGETNWSFTQIIGGLSPGVFVITTPEAEGLKDGAKVRVE